MSNRIFKTHFILIVGKLRKEGNKIIIKIIIYLAFRQKD